MAYQFNPFTGNFDVVRNLEVVTTASALTNGWSLSISTTVPKQTFYISADSASQSSSNTPFGSTAPINGAEITLVGASDSLFPRIIGANVAKGIIGFSSYELHQGETITFKYISSLDRFVIVGKSNNQGNSRKHKENLLIFIY